MRVDGPGGAAGDPRGAGVAGGSGPRAARERDGFRRRLQVAARGRAGAGAGAGGAGAAGARGVPGVPAPSPGAHRRRPVAAGCVPAAPSPPASLGPGGASPGRLPGTEAATPVARAEAVQAAVAWIARGAVAAAAAPGVLRLRLEDRRLGRVGVEVRVRRGRVTVRLAAAPKPLAELLAEADALEAALASRGLALAGLRGG